MLINKQPCNCYCVHHGILYIPIIFVQPNSITSHSTRVLYCYQVRRLFPGIPGEIILCTSVKNIMSMFVICPNVVTHCTRQISTFTGHP